MQGRKSCTHSLISVSLKSVCHSSQQDKVSEVCHWYFLVRQDILVLCRSIVNYKVIKNMNY
jgi:hypothetical protein